MCVVAFVCPDWLRFAIEEPSFVLRGGVCGRLKRFVSPEFSHTDRGGALGVSSIPSVPIAFFGKHVQGSYDHIKTAKLRTDASDKTWLVKVDGLKLTDGWKDFACAHDLRVGDIIIFRHEGDMVFHVTPFGPSCCDIQYTSPSSHNINDDSHDQPTNKTGTRTMSFDYCFLAELRAQAALNKQCQEMLPVNKEDKSWTVSFAFSESGSKYYISRGWRKWCVDNSCDIGDLFGFNLVGDGKSPPLLCVCPESKECAELPRNTGRKRGITPSTTLLTRSIRVGDDLPILF
ncbi:hypothetical protein Bca52824_021515 [Brassica carinata]|uniref:TF-B3 domain-containing protein n=1 Tax=Brassica carinata TaxID=52824 RepID=A0A8X7VEV4_BRACI|nr:hypothetical protein Bca52824_021515 [Brassica carinata]